MMSHVSPDVVDLIQKMLVYNADDRITASQALKHPYFKELRESEQMVL
jgi:renal tumor antigen